MKKQSVILLAIIVSASSFLFSCGNIVNKSTGALEFDSIQINRTTHLFGDTAKPACNLILHLAYVTQSSDESFKERVNQILISAALGKKYGIMYPSEAARQYAEDYEQDYRNDLEPMYLKDAQEEGIYDIGSWYAYYKHLESHIQRYARNLLVYQIDYEEYTGGAHGIYMTTFLNLNLQTLTPIRLEDLFVKNYQEELTDLLWNQLMADNRVTTRQELEDMGYASTGDLEPTENFALGKTGITFYYNVYEIAPYVMGSTQITLPYESIAHLLNKEEGIID